MARLHLPTLVFEGRLTWGPPVRVWPGQDLNLHLGGLQGTLPCCLQISIKRSKGEMFRGQGEERRKSLENSKDGIPDNHPRITPSVSEIKRSTEGEDAENRKLAVQVGWGCSLSLTSSFLT